MCCSDEEFIARSYASLFADSSIAKNSCVPAWATLMTREEKVHGSFSQGSQPLTSSFQRLRVKVCKFYDLQQIAAKLGIIGCNARNEGLNLTGWWTTRRKWCNFSSPQHVSYPLSRCCDRNSGPSHPCWFTTSILHPKNQNVCSLLRWCPPACSHYCCCLFSSRFLTRMTCMGAIDHMSVLRLLCMQYKKRKLLCIIRI
jgi:hypothetical protein